MLIKSDNLSKQTHLSNSLTFSSTSQKMKEFTSFFVLLNLVFPLVHSHSESYADFPFDTCSIENKSCEIHSDSFIESFTVNDLEECRQLCEYSENCQYFSHFGANNFPLSNHCILFSNCLVLEDCGDCYTEDRLCHGSCGRSFESKHDDNVIELIPDVELERTCKGLCRANADCLYYTHYGRDSAYFPHLCILLSDLPSPSQECENCVTSIPDCSNTSYISCKFSIDSDLILNDSFVFTNVDDTINVTFSLSASLGCKATVIAIGGGGYNYGHGYGGGGSGYVMSDVIDVSSTEYQVSVGQQGQESVFRIKNGQNVITAQAGRDGLDSGDTNGGDGYSGGGAKGNNGGSDGSDGNGGLFGGSGSGLDISTISLRYHMLSPGKGSEHYYDYGGSGGGVLVDNVGPSSNNYQGECDPMCPGEGYGGGGNNYGPGLQGMILIETKSKP